MHYLDQFANMMGKKKKPFELINGHLYSRREYWVSPTGPASFEYRLSDNQCKYLLNKLGGFWVMWTDGFGPQATGTEWYAVICRTHKSLEEIPEAKRRNEIRRALRECEVRRVSAEEIATLGYEVYCAAMKGYKNASTENPTITDFQRRVRSDGPFQDIRHQWAVYCSGKMVAFAQNIIYEKIEAQYSLIKLHPDYLKHYPAYALIYKMNEYYLAEQKFQYVNDGFRSISHDTGIQDFLIKKFGFEKAYTGLHVHYRFPLGQVLSAAKPFRTVIQKIFPQANPLFELDRIRMKQAR